MAKSLRHRHQTQENECILRVHGHVLMDMPGTRIDLYMSAEKWCMYIRACPEGKWRLFHHMTVQTWHVLCDGYWLQMGQVRRNCERITFVRTCIISSVQLNFWCFFMQEIGKNVCMSSARFYAWLLGIVIGAHARRRRLVWMHTCDHLASRSIHISRHLLWYRFEVFITNMWR